MSSCHSQTHGLGKVMGTGVMVAFGPSDVYCGLNPFGAGMVMVGTIIPGGILYGETSWMIKPEGLLDQQIYMWISQPPHLHTVVHYGLGNGSLIFLNCHRVSAKVGHIPALVSRNAASLPVNIFHRNELPYSGLSPLLQ